MTYIYESNKGLNTALYNIFVVIIEVENNRMGWRARLWWENYIYINLTRYKEERINRTIKWETWRRKVGVSVCGQWCVHRKLSHPLHTVALPQHDDAVILETASLTLVRGIKLDFELSNQCWYLTNNDLQYMKTVNTMTHQRLVSLVSHRNSVLGSTTMVICVLFKQC